MKKIIAALTIGVFAFCNAQAQQSMRVCRKGSNNNVSCYNTKYAQNFPVCKDGNGYHICGENVNRKNSTNTAGMSKTATAMNEYDNFSSNDVSTGWEGYKAPAPMHQDMTPKSQSYPDYEANVTVPYRTGYGEDRKGSVKVCYFGDNVAELNRNPYKGCDAPQYDGPDRNKERAWANGN